MTRATWTKKHQKDKVRKWNHLFLLKRNKVEREREKRGQ